MDFSMDARANYILTKANIFSAKLRRIGEFSCDYPLLNEHLVKICKCMDDNVVDIANFEPDEKYCVRDIIVYNPIAGAMHSIIDHEFTVENFRVEQFMDYVDGLINEGLEILNNYSL